MSQHDGPRKDDARTSDAVPLHQRHKPPTPLEAPRELIVACPEMRSNVNLSRIVRAAGCCGVRQLISAGRGTVDAKIARDALEQVELVRRRSLAGPLRKLRQQGYCLVALEQASQSVPLWDYRFPRATVLIVGHERKGVEPELLGLADAVVEIPVYGRPHSFNAATSAAIAIYEYCRQHPS